jgi:hypothetical protein
VRSQTYDKPCFYQMAGNTGYEISKDVAAHMGRLAALSEAEPEIQEELRQYLKPSGHIRAILSQRTKEPHNDDFQHHKHGFLHGNGSTTAFAVNYVFFGTGTTSEIQVVEVVIATGAETVKSNGSDFTVSGGSTVQPAR